MKRLLAIMVCVVSVGAHAAEPDYPKARAAMRLILHDSGDQALAAQAKYFPEHYDMLVGLLVEVERREDPTPVLKALGRTSAQHWDRYNELVRMGKANDFRALVEQRRDLFRLIREHGDADLCLAYEYRGTQALTGKESLKVYEAAVGQYVATFIAAAATARDEPTEWSDPKPEEMQQLHERLRERTGGGELVAALNPSLPVHRRFCEAMAGALDASLSFEGVEGTGLWRFLVTRAPAPTEPTETQGTPDP